MGSSTGPAGRAATTADTPRTDGATGDGPLSEAARGGSEAWGHVVERVRGTLDEVFAAVAATGADTSALLADLSRSGEPRSDRSHPGRSDSGPSRSDASRSGREPLVADLAALRPGLHARLAAHPLVSGLGFVAAPGLLGDAPGWLEWWQRGPGGAVGPLLLDLDPEHSAYSDYTHWDWYTLPRETGSRAVAGPYVDYLCSDEYGLTLSAPVTLDGRFVGVAAADVYLRHFEAAVLPALQRLPAPARLVNARGRVAASTDPAHLVGSLTKGPDFGAVLAGPPAGRHADGLRLLPCAGTPLVLVTAED
ncbi:cache domain-containing protein [Streptomyces exfoliatus]|uniref:cache domain-containing protein n=1 Tax=Streptomyces exfoliatus TaxID=1905 RepID=UPI003C30AE17